MVDGDPDMYERILIPTDGSYEGRKAIQHAVDLAASMDATLHALFVIEEGGNPWESEAMEDQLDRAREYGRQITDEVGEAAAEAGVEFVGATKVGPKVHDEINEYVEEEDIDCVVLGSGYHGQIGGLLGSVTDKFLRTANVPVLVIRRTES